jgi:hypothetical protein
MAGTTDPRAADFDAGVFRDAIQFAMRMGAPNQTADKVTFRWKDKKTYTREDPNKKPYDWTSSPATDVTHQDVVIEEVAIELTQPRVGQVLGTPVGQFEQVRAVLTLLDVDFARIDGATNPPDVVLIDQSVYEIRFINSLALFDVDLYQITAVAVDVT